VSRRSQVRMASVVQAARRGSPWSCPYSRTMRAWRGLLLRMVLSMSNAAAGRSGRMEARAERRIRVCCAFWARAPKGSPVTIDERRSSRRCRGGKGASFGRKTVSSADSTSVWIAVGPALAKKVGPRAGGGGEGVVGKVGKWTLVVALCGAACTQGHTADPGDGSSVGTQPDAGPADAGPVDAGPVDAGPVDAGPTDAGPADAGPADAGPADAGP